MSPLEIRIIAYAIALGLFAWGIHTLDAHHYERIAQAEKLAQAALVEAQQGKTIAALQLQQAAIAAAEKQYVDLKASADGTARQLSDSVRAFTQLRSGIVSATSTAAAAADAASEGARRNTELAGLVQHATEACLGDAAQLTALQTWATTFSTSH